MAFQILMNILIAVMWVFMQSSYTVGTFIFGYLIGLFVLFILRRFLVYEFYLRRVWAFMKLIILFIVELTKANIDVMKVVLRPKQNHQPGIVAVQTNLETNIEITLLAALISLTPGTVSMDFSDDSKTIYIHALDVPDKDEFIADIHNSFERAIMEVTK